ASTSSTTAPTPSTCSTNHERLQRHRHLARRCRQPPLEPLLGDVSRDYPHVTTKSGFRGSEPRAACGGRGKSLAKVSTRDLDPDIKRPRFRDLPSSGGTMCTH